MEKSEKRDIYEVFCPIYGLIMDANEPYKIGDYTFYQFPRDQLSALKKYMPETNDKIAEQWFMGFEEYPSVVSVKIHSPDIESAKARANSCFARLENIFCVNLFEVHGTYDVSIFEPQRLSIDLCLVISEQLEGQHSFSTKGTQRCIQFSKFLEVDSRIFSDLIAKLTSKSLNEIEKSIFLAIDFCSLAIKSIGKPSGFVQAITAIECLCSSGKRGIAQGVSDNYAFVMGGSLGERKKLRDSIKEMYRTRSKLAHGEIASISETECNGAIQYAYNLILQFLFTEPFSSMTSKSNFDEYIENQKFGISEVTTNA